MSIRINATQQIAVSLSDEEARWVTREYIYQKFDWKDSYFIEDGKVCDMVEYTTSHRWESKEVIREAKHTDKLLYQLFKEL